MLIPTHQALVDKALARLHLTFSSQERLEDLAAAVGSSVFHLCRVFRKQTGFTICRYRHELRLKKAEALLAHGSDDILTIAVALGYSGHSHFTGVFRRRFGVTPSAFRNALRGRAPRMEARGSTVFTIER